MSDAAQLIDPLPLFATLTVFAAGAAPFITPEKERAAGDTVSAGGAAGAASVSPTVIVLGEPLAPAALTVTVAE